MFDALVGLIIRWRIAVLVAVAATAAAAAWFAVGIRFDFSPQTVLEGDDAIVRQAERYKAMFGSADAVVLVVLEAVGKDDVLSPEALPGRRPSIASSPAWRRCGASIRWQISRCPPSRPCRHGFG